MTAGEALGVLLAVEGRRLHGVHEDVLAILSGTLLVSLGVVVFAKASLLTGGLVGLALLLDHLTPVGFWLAFLLLNLPLLWLASLQRGRAFVVRSTLAVVLACALTQGAAQWIDIASIDPVYAALVGGILIGFGLMTLLRHNTSLGGVGILALYLQERHGLRAGSVQLAVDAAVLLAACATLTPREVALSLVGTLTVNGFLVVFHRSDRYVGVT